MNDYIELYKKWTNSSEIKLVKITEKEIDGLTCKIEQYNYKHFANQWFFFVNGILIGVGGEYAEYFSIFGEDF